MAQLVLLVVAAAWAAVLIPPMLRSRVDNRPNSSVTDFRRQLHRLQSTATPPRGATRAMGRPLAQSPLQRQAAAGRPGMPASRSGGTAVRDRTGEAPRMRSHGDPSGGHRRPPQARPAQARPAQARSERRPDHSQGHRRPDQSRGQRRPDQAHGHRRPVDAPAQRSHDNTNGTRRLLDDAAVIKRRRTNVLFILVVTSACTMFLAATTDSTAMLWIFGVSFLATCGYLYVLAQLRENEPHDGWLDHR